MSINLMILQRADTHTGEIKKGWTSYRDIANYKSHKSLLIVSNCDFE